MKSFSSVKKQEESFKAKEERIKRERERMVAKSLELIKEGRQKTLWVTQM